jgi:hypothetical protein
MTESMRSDPAKLGFLRRFFQLPPYSGIGIGRATDFHRACKNPVGFSGKLRLLTPELEYLNRLSAD